MIVNLLPEKCIACGLCQVLAPDVFDYTDEGIVIFTEAPDRQQFRLDDSLVEQGMAAYKHCPTRAIVVPK
ncbi:ferredoxin [uncultured Vagococcus sp.]|uniref:ferredoxin n=1 Tax=uncultured Vagococcus sp. TaxID=189676 RepID=UPI0028D57A31|nr:ferredoxin [uncultured Vagococcus sp.]